MKWSSKKGSIPISRCDIKMERWIEPNAEQSLDPANWEEFRQLGHRMVDDMMHYLQTVSERPAWQPIPTKAVESLAPNPSAIPTNTRESVYEEFLTTVLPYNKNNIHPRFWSWVEGGGNYSACSRICWPKRNESQHSLSAITPPSMSKNQVLDWCKQIFSFPATAGGIPHQRRLHGKYHRPGGQPGTRPPVTG